MEQEPGIEKSGKIFDFSSFDFYFKLEFIALLYKRTWKNPKNSEDRLRSL